MSLSGVPLSLNLMAVYSGSPATLMFVKRSKTYPIII